MSQESPSRSEKMSAAGVLLELVGMAVVGSVWIFTTDWVAQLQSAWLTVTSTATWIYTHPVKTAELFGLLMLTLGLLLYFLGETT
jgi:hypothetical protein